MKEEIGGDRWAGSRGSFASTIYGISTSATPRLAHCELVLAVASFRRQMPYIADHAPHFIVLEKSLPARHSTQTDAIFDDPFQLPVCVILNIFAARSGTGGEMF